MNSHRFNQKNRASKSATLAVVTAFAVVLLGGHFGAAGAATATKISACQTKKTGAVRIVKAGAKCLAAELAVSWGVAGPAGAKGAQGPAGAKGDAGAAGA